MKTMTGIVKTAKTPQTAVVVVQRRWRHPLYKKYVKRTKSYACHVPEGQLQAGDRVEIAACRPMSRTKRFQVVNVLGAA
jgi:small subunit ribosomal protein S17